MTHSDHSQTLPLISVVIPTFNRKNLLDWTLRSIQNSGYPMENMQIIVVDDASDDGTFGFCRGIQTIRCIRHEENKGRAATRNTGLAKADGEYIFLLDDDQVIPPGYFTAHLQIYSGYHDCIATVGQYRTPPPYRNRWGIYSEQRGPVRFKDDSKSLSAKYFQGGNVSIRRSALLKTGFFDPQFDRYGGEDVDLGQRLKDYGSIYFCREGYSDHFGIQPLDNHLDRLQEFGADGLVKLFKKHPSLSEEYGLKNFKFPRALLLNAAWYHICRRSYPFLPQTLASLCISYCIAYRVFQGYTNSNLQI